MLILSVFPGIDLLGRAFEEVWPEACVVRGPDLLWGGDIHSFFPPAGVFDGVIGGPPCQIFSRLRYLNPLCGKKHGNLIPEFERVVYEAQPTWFLMENVPEAPAPVVSGYQLQSLTYNNRWAGGIQHRVRRFSFGSRQGLRLLVDEVLFETPEQMYAVLAGHGPALGQRSNGSKTLTIAEMCKLQGLSPILLSEAPFTAHGKREVIGNGVPLPMGRAIATAVWRAVTESMD